MSAVFFILYFSYDCGGFIPFQLPSNAVPSCLIFGINCEICRGVSQYSQCSMNDRCSCFQKTSDRESGICGSLWLSCSQFGPCETGNHICQNSDHICVHHPRCHHHSICYPLAIAHKFCPSITNSSSSTSRPDDGICAKATWSENATTVAGGDGQGSQLNQLNYPSGLFIDDNQTIFVADSRNHRIVKWSLNATNGEIVAGNGRAGSASNQLDSPQDVIVDNNGTIYISDTINGRIQQWFKGATNGQTIVGNIDPVGLAQDSQESIYVTDWLMGQVTKLNINGTIDQVIVSNLSFPYMLFIDRNQSIYIADTASYRIIKVDNETKNVSVVAGGSPGGNLSQLSWPEGVLVDQLGTVYVADTHNHRIIQWPSGATSGNVIAGNQGPGSASNQLYYPSDLSFDLEGNLYVVDNGNNRVQKFLINKNSC